MKILITGSNGYIGRHIVEMALQTKHEIICVDRNPSVSTRVKSIEMDFLKNAENPDLYTMLGKPDVIINLAWQDGFNHRSESHLKNLHAHYAFIRNMIDSGCKNISIMGSMHEIGYHEGKIDRHTPCNPLSLYGISKNALRQAVLIYSEEKKVSLKWFRAFYVTGDDTRNKSVFSKILEMEKAGKSTFPLTSGTNKYDFLDIDVLAQQIIKASLQIKINGIINLCSGEPISLKDKVEEFIQKHHLHIKPEYGAFPSRKYDSPAVWGDASIIQEIMKEPMDDE